MKRVLVIAAVLAALSLACKGQPDAAQPASGADAPGGSTMAATFSLRSPAFDSEQEIPKKYTCEGGDTAPPLEWSGFPPSTKSFALVIDDPDAPDPAAPKTTWVHWVVYNMPATTTSLPEGGALPAGAKQGLNDWKRASYGGPCPPIGRHRYFHKLYALDVVLPDLGSPTKAELESAMRGHIVGSGVLMGTYQKKG